MKKGIITDIDWEYIGAVFANEDAEDQAKFFKAMLKESFTWGSSYQSEKQLAAINGKLTEDEKESLKMLSYQVGDEG
jgi:hypothetical protein